MNEQAASGRAQAAASANPGRQVVRWVCTKNPFYVISAVLVLTGLRASFDPEAKVFHAWALLGGLAGYTLLLAAMACVLVRLGNVWNDVRTLLLLVVLGFLTISVIFDDVLVKDPRDVLVRNPSVGTVCNCLGLAFAVMVSEGLLRGMRLRLSAWYRAPYYLILGLFFGYPVMLAWTFRGESTPELWWALFGFSPLAGVLFLTLLPAVWKGPSYVSKNGSPWRWPLYPWVLFGVLGLGVCSRSYYLCLSMDAPRFPELNQTIFAPFFWVPFLFAVNLLLLEGGLKARRRSGVRGPLRLALSMPACLIMFTLIGYRHETMYLRFLRLFLESYGGSPLFLTLAGCVGLYALAALRRAPGASGCLAVSLGALSVVGPRSLGLSDLVRPQPGPLVALAVLQGWLAVRRNSSARGIIAVACLVITIGVAIPDRWPIWIQRAAIFHLALLGVLFLGALFDDALARWLRGGSAALLAAAGLWATFGRFDAGPGPSEYVRLYALGLLGLALGYGFLVASRWFFGAALVVALAWLTELAWRGYAHLKLSLAGLDMIAVGLAFFLLAAFISLAKTGALAGFRWLRSCPPYRSSGPLSQGA
jgi:hypothetical protein